MPTIRQRQILGGFNVYGLDLFSGIGGLTKALEGYVIPVAYCEIDSYCRGVLLSRMSAGGGITAMEKRDSQRSNPDYYVNCRGEVILKPIINVQKLHGEYVIFDPLQTQEPSKFMVIGRNATWRIKAR